MDSNTRLAACVILMRPGPAAEHEIYLVRRSPKLSFLGGFHAFPGGTVDPVDHEVEVVSGSDAGALYSCALRELYEEVGVFTLGDSVAEDRRVLMDDSTVWERILDGRSIDAAGMIPMGAWVTPPYTPVVYDARYYGLNLPAGQEADVWDGELTEGRWITPSAALLQHEHGELFISYPVLETLRVMAETPGDLETASKRLVARGKDPYPLAGGEMISGVSVVPVRTFTLPPATHTNCYVLGHTELAIVDPATPVEEDQNRLVAYVQHLIDGGAVLREIWLTHQHRDHVGAVECIREAFNVPVCAHRLTAEALAPEIRVDTFIEDEQVLTLPSRAGPDFEWVALHTPGHAVGHLCFYERNRHSLISGDNVVGLGTVVIAPPEGNMIQYFDSLRRMMDRPLGFMFPAHGPPIAAARERIEFYIEHRTAREEKILAATDPARTAEEIVPVVYTDLDPRVYPLAQVNVQAHLEKLVAEGRVVEEAGRFARSG